MSLTLVLGNRLCGLGSFCLKGTRTQSPRRTLTHEVLAGEARELDTAGSARGGGCTQGAAVQDGVSAGAALTAARSLSKGVS